MTPENMKAWEERLGPEKVQRAIDLVYSHGWRPRDNPPTWVWAEAFRQVETGTEVFGANGPSLQESIFGCRLF